MLFINSIAVKRKRLEHVFEGDAVIGFLKHLLGQIQMALGRLQIRVDSQGKRPIDDKFRRIKKSHQEFNSVPFVLGHQPPVGQVFAERDFMREPAVPDRLIVKVISPLVIHGMEIHVRRRGFS